MVECSGSSPTQTPFATCAQTMSAQPLRSSRFHPRLVEFFTLATCAEILCLGQISEIWICPLPRQSALPNAFTWNSVLTRANHVCPATAQFQIPSTAGGVLHFGNMRRNSLLGPDFRNMDLSLAKTNPITEPLHWEL